VLWALWRHYREHRDIDFAHRLYTEMVIRCADFMVDFRDESGLPRPSWNLWENALGVHTFTCATVVAGLNAAACFADVFAETERSHRYRQAADEIIRSIETHLYSNELGRFLRSLRLEGDAFIPDATIDASLFGLFYFDCFLPDDERVVGTMKAIESELSSGGGIGRFQNDDYMRANNGSVGNPWFICTLWLAEYYIAIAKTVADLGKAIDILRWTARAALPSGVLAEQLDPASGAPLSVSPLTWSHSTFVAAVHSYLKKLKQLS
jgi:GH15 family glucan-1,4-alpha-glucosidase